MRLQELSVLIPEEGKIRTGRNNWEIKRLKNVSEGTINVNSAVASFRASHVFIIVLFVERKIVQAFQLTFINCCYIQSLNRHH